MERTEHRLPGRKRGPEGDRFGFLPKELAELVASIDVTTCGFYLGRS